MMNVFCTTALHLTAVQGLQDISRLLIQYGADSGIYNVFGESASTHDPFLSSPVW